MPDKIKLLYETVSKDYDVGTYDEFASKLQDPGKRKAFYNGVGKEYDLGNYSDFETKVGGGKKSARPNWFKEFWNWLCTFPI